MIKCKIAFDRLVSVPSAVVTTLEATLTSPPMTDSTEDYAHAVSFAIGQRAAYDDGVDEVDHGLHDSCHFLLFKYCSRG